MSIATLTLALQIISTTVTVAEHSGHQTIESLGAGTFFFEDVPGQLSGSDETRVYDLAFLDSGATALRLPISYRIEQTNDNGSASSMNLSGFNFTGWAQAQADLITEARSRGVSYVWATCATPPIWMKDPIPPAVQPTLHGGHISSGMEAEFAEFIAAYIKGMDTVHGVTIDAISILNEPDLESGLPVEATWATEAEYAALLQAVADRIALEGYATRIVGPETSDLSASIDYATYLLSDPAGDELSAWATHQYGLDTTTLWSDLLAETQPALLDLHQTEWADLGSTSGSLTDDMELASRINRALTLGNATHWSYFSYWWENSGTGHGLFTAVAPPGTPAYSVPKRYQIFRHHAAHIPSGSTRIGTSGGTGLECLAFLRPVGSRKEYTVVLARTITNNKTVAATVQLPRAPSGPISAYRTSDTEDHDLISVSRSGSDVFVSLTSPSIVTLVIPMGLDGGPGVEVFANPTVVETAGTVGVQLRYTADAAPVSVDVELTRVNDASGLTHYFGSSGWTTAAQLYDTFTLSTDTTVNAIVGASSSTFPKGRWTLHARLLASGTSTPVGVATSAKMMRVD
jgi:O-glycosyl hydrolase